VCPTIYVGDSAEFSEATAVLGVPHPPGYPLYTMLGAVFVRLVRAGDFGYRANLFSAFWGAAAAAVFWVWLRRLNLGHPAALAATMTMAFGTVFWSQSVCAEVHSLNCFLFVLALLMASVAAGHATRIWIFLSGMTVGLLVGHRNLNLLFVPAVVAPLAIRWKHLPRRQSLLAMLWFLAGGLFTAVVYAYLPVAAVHAPPLAMGAPSTWARFFYVVSAHPYFRHLASATVATSAGRFVSFVAGLPGNLGVGVIALPIGFATLLRSPDKHTLLFSVVWTAATCALFSSCYNVLDVESYFLPALIALATVSAIGFDRIGEVRALAFCLPLGALLLAVVNFSSVNLRHDRIGRSYGEDMLRSTPLDAILLSFGDTSTHLLWFLQDVEGQRPDVVVVSVDEISEWYVEKLVQRPGVDWPSMDQTSEWLSDLVTRNLHGRKICLTQPVGMGPPEWEPMPNGLVFCLGEQATRESAVAASLRFWNAAGRPTPGATVHGDVHVKMAAFSYAMARYSLLRLLISMDNEADARTQAAALLASNPDQLEAEIASALASVDKRLFQRFDFGAHAQKLLSMTKWDRSTLLGLFDLQ